MIYTKCLKCGWVHFVVSVDYIRAWKLQWRVFWDASSEQTRENYGLKNGPPSENSYLSCSFCGDSYQNFKDITLEEVPMGSTISPILNRNEIYVD